MPNYQQLQFSNEKQEKLIDLLKKNPPLYGVKNKSYKDIELEENIWRNIAQHPNDSRRLTSPQPQNPKQPLRRTMSSRSPLKKSTSKQDLLKEIQKGRKERLDLLHSFKPNENSQSSHPVDLFFQSMAAIVKTFPPRLMLQARTKMRNIIVELSCKQL